MKYANRITQAVKILFLVASLGIAPYAATQDSLVAMGIVDASTNSLFNSTNTVDGTISVSEQGTGDHDILIDATGAFSGTDSSDYVVEVTVRGSDSDNHAYGIVSNVTNNKLRVTIRQVDLENSVDPYNEDAVDADFYFVIRRIKSMPISAGTSHLIALGRVSQFTGDIDSGFGVDGIALSSANVGTGDYNITLSKTDAFIGDVSNDYVVMAMTNGVTGNGDDERATVFPTITTASDHNIVINVRTHDVQNPAAASSGTPEDEPFHFAVYRIPSSLGNGIPRSQLLIGAANVASDGILSKGATSIPGGGVTSSGTGTGLYIVEINAVGAFAGKNENQYIIQATLRTSTIIDRIVQANAEVVNDDTLRINVQTMDVENDGADNDLEDQAFSVAVYDSVALFQPDLQIGTKKSLSKMKGDNHYNSTGGGQGIRIKLPGTAFKRYYYTVQNDGTTTDDIKLREQGARRILRTKYFKLSGGRTNITAQVRTQLEAISNLRPGRNVRIEAQAKYTNLLRRPNRKLRIKGSSLYVGSASDTVQVRTAPTN